MTVTVNSDFDEEAYLFRYADVRNAVKAGAFSSGYAHYIAFGKAEGRDGATVSSNSIESNSFAYVSPLDLVTGLCRDPTVEVVMDGAGGTDERSRPGASFHDDPDGARLFPALDPVVVPHSSAFTVIASPLRQVGSKFLRTKRFSFNDEPDRGGADGRTRFAAFERTPVSAWQRRGLRPTRPPSALTSRSVALSISTPTTALACVRGWLRPRSAGLKIGCSKSIAVLSMATRLINQTIRRPGDPPRSRWWRVETENPPLSSIRETLAPSIPAAAGTREPRDLHLLPSARLHWRRMVVVMLEEDLPASCSASSRFDIDDLALDHSQQDKGFIGGAV